MTLACQNQLHRQPRRLRQPAPTILAKLQRLNNLTVVGRQHIPDHAGADIPSPVSEVLDDAQAVAAVDVPVDQVAPEVVPDALAEARDVVFVREEVEVEVLLRPEDAFLLEFRVAGAVVLRCVARVHEFEHELHGFRVVVVEVDYAVFSFL